jgi:peptidoglycan-associated lipoprotein
MLMKKSPLHRSFVRISSRGLVGLSLCAAALLAGCASGTRLEPPAPVEDRNNPALNGGANASGADAGRTSQSQVAGVDLTNGGRNALHDGGAGRTVYFDYDSYVVKDEYQPVIVANAKRLTSERNRKMLVEGHTDARGGSEYNLALGQRRADAVVRALTLLGAQDAQLEAVSFGKERPAVQGDDESAFAKNRRVELKDR